MPRTDFEGFPTARLTASTPYSRPRGTQHELLSSLSFVSNCLTCKSHSTNTVLAPPKKHHHHHPPTTKNTTNKHLKWLSLWCIHIKLGRSQEFCFLLSLMQDHSITEFEKKIYSILISCSSGEWFCGVNLYIITGLAVLCDVQLL